MLAVCGEHRELTVQGESQRGYQWIEKQEAFEMMKNKTEFYNKVILNMNEECDL